MFSRVILAALLATSALCTQIVFRLANKQLPIETDFDRVASQVTQHVDALFVDRGVFSTVLVAHHDRVHHVSRGSSHLNPDRNNTVTTATKIASITKQFTAIAILLLQEDGHLNVTDTLETYLPGFPQGSDIQLHHLLQHTSGYPQEAELLLLPICALKREIPLNEVVDELRRRAKKLDFAPGTNWAYSNAGYVLLSKVIELVSGMDYQDFMKKRVFEPAGMRHTFIDRHLTPEHLHATGYVINNLHRPFNYTTAMHINMDCATGAGAIATSALELLTYHRIMQKDALLTPASRHLMEDGGYRVPDTPVDRPLYYGYGIGIATYGSSHYRLLTHSGGLPGYRTLMWRFPELDMVIIALINTDYKDDEEDFRFGIVKTVATFAIGE